jgi:hypothetical protein
MVGQGIPEFRSPGDLFMLFLETVQSNDAIKGLTRRSMM